LTGYLTSQITSHMTKAAQGGNPLEASASGFGDTYFLAACIAAVGFLLTLMLSKPKQQPDAAKDQAAEGAQADPSLMAGH
ncbi:MAG: MFS transporter, partial [Paenibacillaceae bacterium]|nr:MFS transporter [Paenibacillaceae bacterium]